MLFKEYLEKALNEALNEASVITIDVDYVCDDSIACKKLQKKHNIKIKMTSDTTADATGKKKDLLAWMEAAGYGDEGEVLDMYPELG